jgi:hypothetical protein
MHHSSHGKQCRPDPLTATRMLNHLTVSGRAASDVASSIRLALLPAVLAGLLAGRTPGPAGAADALRQAFIQTDEAMVGRSLRTSTPPTLKLFIRIRVSA